MTFFPPWTSRALPSKIIYLQNAKINTKIKSDGRRFFDKNAKKTDMHTKSASCIVILWGKRTYNCVEKGIDAQNIAGAKIIQNRIEI